ncbi:hypothetical protein GUJ93_ZPchr0006g42531 [Zizania palustris]|uniref:Uncharacterized protein n=1 Tax=Zizania palustris TaxID=103762 RepID=A0A8J5W2V4_ZIZPA|nr:hypothetical protein GUJ93_ZPchr0006g42531 [Zizania palustris]
MRTQQQSDKRDICKFFNNFFLKTRHTEYALLYRKQVTKVFTLGLPVYNVVHQQTLTTCDQNNSPASLQHRKQPRPTKLAQQRNRTSQSTTQV